MTMYCNQAYAKKVRSAKILDFGYCVHRSETEVNTTAGDVESIGNNKHFSQIYYSGFTGKQNMMHLKSASDFHSF